MADHKDPTTAITHGTQISGGNSPVRLQRATVIAGVSQIMKTRTWNLLLVVRNHVRNSPACQGGKGGESSCLRTCFLAAALPPADPTVQAPTDPNVNQQGEHQREPSGSRIVLYVIPPGGYPNHQAEGGKADHKADQTAHDEVQPWEDKSRTTADQHGCPNRSEKEKNI